MSNTLNISKYGVLFFSFIFILSVASRMDTGSFNGNVNDITIETFALVSFIWFCLSFKYIKNFSHFLIGLFFLNPYIVYIIMFLALVYLGLLDYETDLFNFEKWYHPVNIIGFVYLFYFKNDITTGFGNRNSGEIDKVV